MHCESHRITDSYNRQSHQLVASTRLLVVRPLQVLTTESIFCFERIPPVEKSRAAPTKKTTEWILCVDVQNQWITRAGMNNTSVPCTKTQTPGTTGEMRSLSLTRESAGADYEMATFNLDHHFVVCGLWLPQSDLLSKSVS